MVLATIPTVSPWAIIFRASGASFADAHPQIFFQTGEDAFKGVVTLPVREIGEIIFANFFHQIFDSMWQSLQTWFFPILGPFPLLPVPDYTGYYLWLEIASPSEWLFLMASLVIVADMLGMMPSRPIYYQIGAGILGVMGIFLVVAGWFDKGGSLFAPSYTATTSALAGLLAIVGAAALIHMSKRGIRYT